MRRPWPALGRSATAKKKKERCNWVPTVLLKEKVILRLSCTDSLSLLLYVTNNYYIRNILWSLNHLFRQVFRDVIKFGLFLYSTCIVVLCVCVCVRVCVCVCVCECVCVCVCVFVCLFVPDDVSCSDGPSLLWSVLYICVVSLINWTLSPFVFYLCTHFRKLNYQI